MKKESLLIAREIIIDALDKVAIYQPDVAELMINEYRFLDPEHYEDNIKTLQKRRIQYEQESFFARDNTN